MSQITIEESKLKKTVLDVLNDLFNIGDIEEARRTPIGRLISLEGKVEKLTSEVQFLERSLRGEISSLDKRVNERIDSLDERLCQRIDSLDERLNQRIDSLDKRFDDLDKHITSRIGDLDKRLTDQGRLLYIILAALLAGLIKLIFFP
jgi:predicted transcriptional regulator